MMTTKTRIVQEVEDHPNSKEINKTKEVSPSVSTMSKNHNDNDNNNDNNQTHHHHDTSSSLSCSSPECIPSSYSPNTKTRKLRARTKESSVYAFRFMKSSLNPRGGLDNEEENSMHASQKDENDVFLLMNLRNNVDSVFIPQRQQQQPQTSSNDNDSFPDESLSQPCEISNVEMSTIADNLQTTTSIELNAKKENDLSISSSSLSSLAPFSPTVLDIASSSVQKQKSSLDKVEGVCIHRNPNNNSSEMSKYQTRKMLFRSSHMLYKSSNQRSIEPHVVEEDQQEQTTTRTNNKNYLEHSDLSAAAASTIHLLPSHVLSQEARSSLLPTTSRDADDEKSSKTKVLFPQKNISRLVSTSEKTVCGSTSNISISSSSSSDPTRHACKSQCSPSRTQDRMSYLTPQKVAKSGNTHTLQTTTTTNEPMHPLHTPPPSSMNPHNYWHSVPPPPPPSSHYYYYGYSNSQHHTPPQHVHDERSNMSLPPPSSYPPPYGYTSYLYPPSSTHHHSYPQPPYMPKETIPTSSLSSYGMQSHMHAAEERHVDDHDENNNKNDHNITTKKTLLPPLSSMIDHDDVNALKGGQILKPSSNVHDEHDNKIHHVHDHHSQRDDSEEHALRQTSNMHRDFSSSTNKDHASSSSTSIEKKHQTSTCSNELVPFQHHPVDLTTTSSNPSSHTQQHVSHAFPPPPYYDSHYAPHPPHSYPYHHSTPYPPSYPPYHHSPYYASGTTPGQYLPPPTSHYYHPHDGSRYAYPPLYPSSSHHHPHGYPPPPPPTSHYFSHVPPPPPPSLASSSHHASESVSKEISTTMAEHGNINETMITTLNEHVSFGKHTTSEVNHSTFEAIHNNEKKTNSKNSQLSITSSTNSSGTTLSSSSTSPIRANVESAFPTSSQSNTLTSSTTALSRSSSLNTPSTLSLPSSQQPYQSTTPPNGRKKFPSALFIDPNVDPTVAGKRAYEEYLANEERKKRKKRAEREEKRLKYNLERNNIILPKQVETNIQQFENKRFESLLDPCPTKNEILELITGLKENSEYRLGEKLPTQTLRINCENFRMHRFGKLSVCLLGRGTKIDNNKRRYICDLMDITVTLSTSAHGIVNVKELVLNTPSHKHGKMLYLRYSLIVDDKVVSSVDSLGFTTITQRGIQKRNQKMMERNLKMQKQESSSSLQQEEEDEEDEENEE
ncbi:hypothetical protein C9374_006545 [Naegleria lovaniensis]|uniref:Uncharacterized protein n=1 Tax=Naegleria lovaniensis TaxID=51637 RepID=A0AA88GIX7_NAELO|nr:uncharacterized protein C9374_006545 [Naegleria lovaniensis]KAG2379428.1 hypothetical protein C9374_006545 [Naegleria lovaniensis]